MELCLFGGAGAAVSEKYILATELLGERMAARGHGLVFGGGAAGMMGAAARGVHRGGGRVTGVAPSFLDRPGVLSALCDELIVTETMRERKRVMRERADGFIAAPGGIGTLDEFFEVLTLRSLDRHAKPVALYNVGGYYDGLLLLLRRMQDEGFVSPSVWDCLGVFSDPDALLRYMESSINCETMFRN